MNDTAVAILAAALVRTRGEVAQAGVVRALRDAAAALVEAALAEEEERVSFWDSDLAAPAGQPTRPETPPATRPLT